MWVLSKSVLILSFFLFFFFYFATQVYGWLKKSLTKRDTKGNFCIFFALLHLLFQIMGFCAKSFVAPNYQIYILGLLFISSRTLINLLNVSVSQFTQILIRDDSNFFISCYFMINYSIYVINYFDFDDITKILTAIDIIYRKIKLILSCRR